MYIYIYISIYIKIQCVCLCVCLCLNHGLTALPIDLVFGKNCHLKPLSYLLLHLDGELHFFIIFKVVIDAPVSIVSYIHLELCLDVDVINRNIVEP